MSETLNQPASPSRRCRRCRRRSGPGQRRGGASQYTTMLTDRFGRNIEYLRLSVTDRCDLRCAYCIPEG